MVTKATDSVLNLVSPPISNMVLSQGTLDNVVIGASVPNTGKFTAITDTSIASPLVGAPAGLLVGIGIGSGLQIVGSTLSALTTPGGTPLPPTGLTLYIRSDGNNSNDGSANDSAHAFATITGAMTYVNNKYFLAGNRALILNLGQSGTYAAPTGVWPVGSNIFINGLSGTASDYVVTGGLSQDVFVVAGSTLTIENLTISNLGITQNWCSSESGGQIFIQNVTIACAFTNNTLAIFNAFPGGVIWVLNTTITCDAGGLFYAHGTGSINLSSNNSSTVTFLGGPNFSTAMAVIFDLGFMVAGTATMSGVASGIRFQVFNNGVCNVEGQGINFFPGTSPGTTATGGIYQA